MWTQPPARRWQGAIAKTASGRVVDLEMMPQGQLSDLLFCRLQGAGHRLERRQRFDSTGSMAGKTTTAIWSGERDRFANPAQGRPRP